MVSYIKREEIGREWAWSLLTPDPKSSVVRSSGIVDPAKAASGHPDSDRRLLGPGEAPGFSQALAEPRSGYLQSGMFELSVWESPFSASSSADELVFKPQLRHSLPWVRSGAPLERSRSSCALLLQYCSHVLWNGLFPILLYTFSSFWAGPRNSFHPLLQSTHVVSGCHMCKHS